MADVARLQVCYSSRGDGVDAVVADGLLPPAVGHDERVGVGEALVDEHRHSEARCLHEVVVQQHTRAVQAHLREVRVEGAADVALASHDVAQWQCVADQVRHGRWKHPEVAQVHAVDAAVEVGRQQLKQRRGVVCLKSRCGDVAPVMRPLRDHLHRLHEVVGVVVDEVAAVDDVIPGDEAGERADGVHAGDAVDAARAVEPFDRDEEKRAEARHLVVVVERGAEVRHEAVAAVVGPARDVQRHEAVGDVVHAGGADGDALRDVEHACAVHRAPRADQRAGDVDLRDGDDGHGDAEEHEEVDGRPRHVHAKQEAPDRGEVAVQRCAEAAAARSGCSTQPAHGHGVRGCVVGRGGRHP
ncbi:hypothetical protein NESM_000907500 [Novymonas esmeraldas]|uniref:Uncharacterized protein n=1 Tax=Novymonas esmeraldas TaxID=1808958 RepID=A0AAW0F1R3_9TRYP